MIEIRNVRAKLAVILLTLIATACANSLTSYRTERFGRDGPAVITQDAKTRNLIMVPEQTAPAIPGSPTPRANQWRVCAEAAPDVFNAMSASAAARFALNLENNNAQTNAEGAMSLAEVAGTIERTAFINMLREAMYRTCERYLSGAIDRASFVVQAGRDWRMMLYGLSIQQLTQATRPPSTILVPPTTSASLAPADREKLIAAQERLVKATTDYRTAEDLICTAAGSGGGGGGQEDGHSQDQSDPPAPVIPAADQNDPPPTTPDTNDPPVAAAPDPPALPAGCATRDRDMARAREDQQMARDEIASFGAPVNGTGAVTGTGTSNAGSGGSVPSDTALAIAAPVIRHIIDQIHDTDETQLFCLQILQDRNINPQLQARCLFYLMEKIEVERGNLFRTAAARQAGAARALAMLTAQTRLALFLAGLPEADFEAERQLIQQQLPSHRFCVGMNRAACVNAVYNGEIDADANLVEGIVSNREQARGPR